MIPLYFVLESEGLTMRNRKTLLFITVISMILMIAVTGCGQKNKAILNDQIELLRTTIQDGSIDLGITDMIIGDIEFAVDPDGKTTTLLVSYAESEQFGKMSSAEMLDFFRKLHSIADVSIQHHLGCHADMFGENAYGGLQIRSGGHVYMYRTNGTSPSLYKDGVEFYEFESSGNPDSGTLTIQVICEKCGGDGKYYEWTDDNLYDGQDCPRCEGTGWIEEIHD